MPDGTVIAGWKKGQPKAFKASLPLNRINTFSEKKETKQLHKPKSKHLSRMLLKTSDS